MMPRPSPPKGRPQRFLARGMVLSLALHGGVVVLLLLLWSAPQGMPPQRGQTVPVDLVELGDQTRSPAAPAKAPVPQSLAAPVPKPVRIHTHKAERQAPSPKPQEGVGMSNVTASNGAANGAASYGVKDYIRAQIERRWYPQGAALLRNDWVVQLHLQINPDGSLGRAEIVDDARFDSDSDYREFAYSVRNAALLSAPFSLPPGLDEMARDVTLNFNPRRVQQ